MKYGLYTLLLGIIVLLSACKEEDMTQNTDPVPNAHDVSGWWLATYTVSDTGNVQYDILCALQLNTAGSSIAWYKPNYLTASARVSISPENYMQYSAGMHSAARTDTFMLSGTYGNDSILLFSGAYSARVGSVVKQVLPVQLALHKYPYATAKMEVDKQDVINSIAGNCYFDTRNSIYSISVHLADAQTIVKSAAVAGAVVQTPGHLTLNLYPDKPGQWWTDPDISLPSSQAPAFPWQLIIHLEFTDGTVQDVPLRIPWFTTR